MSSEVQERASTLRHLMAEMQILSLSWESSAEEVKPSELVESKGKGKKGKKGEVAAGAVKETNLLDEVEDLLDMPGAHCDYSLSLTVLPLLLLLLLHQIYYLVYKSKEVQFSSP